LDYDYQNPLSARGAPHPSALQTLQPATVSPSKIVLSDRDFAQIIKAETRRNQVELANLYGSQITNRQHVDKLSRELEVQRERERIQQAQRSLEMERVMNRYKKDNYRQELDQCLQHKQLKDSEINGQQSEGLK